MQSSPQDKHEQGKGTPVSTVNFLEYMHETLALRAQMIAFKQSIQGISQLSSKQNNHFHNGMKRNFLHVRLWAFAHFSHEAHRKVGA